MEEKYLVAFDTICEGHQCAKDEDGNPDPQLHDTHDEAYKELFDDAYHGVLGNEEIFEGSRVEYVSQMSDILKYGSVKEMKKFMSENPQANYYDEFVIKKSEFTLGRKVIFTGTKS